MADVASVGDTVSVKLEKLQQTNSDYGGGDNNKKEWDTESYTNELYDMEYTRVEQEQEDNESDAIPSGKNDAHTTQTTADTTKLEDGYTLVGTGGKVRWEFLLSIDTTDDEIEQTTTTKLRRAVKKVERQLGIQVQPNGVSMGPKEQARKARDALKNKSQPKKGDYWQETTHTLLGMLH